jgi:hypothetical protein
MRDLSTTVGADFPLLAALITALSCSDCFFQSAFLTFLAFEGLGADFLAINFWSVSTTLCLVLSKVLRFLQNTFSQIFLWILYGPGRKERPQLGH